MEGQCEILEHRQNPQCTRITSRACVTAWTLYYYHQLLHIFTYYFDQELVFL
jgi:hypothetical protein